MQYKLKKNKFDSRVKTVVVFIAIFVAAVLNNIYLLTILWLVALFLLFSIKVPIGKIAKRLSIPFGIAWLVFINVIFTNGHIVIHTMVVGPITLKIYKEGLNLGILILMRILATVSLVSVLAFSTDMIEILETLRLCKIPSIIIDIAAMMYRYLYIIGEVTNNMNRARVSRMGNNRSWFNKVSDTGKIAGYVLSKSLDRSVQIYNAMLSRGYNENSKSPNYFQKPIPKFDRCIGGLIVIVLLGLAIIF
ncbi:cobalt ECF transporter T component CbiQ [Clostridium hydrogenum]|uniref:cobalt ECF transporter T component CbiQ n=1 Tax=Clostridium hydrogenum TaxID=2855764 RepID=UPI001F3A7BD8|nr:cobalt ECF transporter T component CbiQ [Clostridium hydrogenum]